MTACIVPTYRASRTILSVVASALLQADIVIVVDDACPDASGDLVTAAYPSNKNVVVLRHDKNRGVGAAFKSGAKRAMSMGADVLVKIDADGQMDASVIPEMLEILAANPEIALVKGNRFYETALLSKMPTKRLVGNSALTLLVRIASGYWRGNDPTNGFLAMRADRVRLVPTEDLAERYFFEISLLCALGIRRASITEIDIPARYEGETSSLSIRKVVTTFPRQLVRAFVKRLIWQYIVSDMNAGTLFMTFGLVLWILGTTLGLVWWIQSLQTGIARTPGTAALVFAPLFIGFQLMLSAITFDIQNSPRVEKRHSESSIRTRRDETWDSP